MHKICSDIAIVAAMDIELRAFDVILEKVTQEDSFNIYSSEIANKKITFIVSGMGQTNVAIATTHLINHYTPQCLLFSGIAGSFRPRFEIGSIVLGKTARSLDLYTMYAAHINETCHYGSLPPEIFNANPQLLELAEQAASALNIPFFSGVLGTSDYFPYPLQMEAILQDITIDTIDMESSAFYQTCYSYNKPALVIRGISNLIHFQEYTLDLTDKVVAAAAMNAARVTTKLISLM
ncbi:MAG: 5'-methylthioadenosine/S-adenosylhomocysteine nucleosidase [Gammaproteobacteria bacterium]